MTPTRSQLSLSLLALATLDACGTSNHGSAPSRVDASTSSDGSAELASGTDGSTSVSRDAAIRRDGAVAADGATDGKVGAPNIVFILADDFSWNLVDSMPELKRMQSEGLSFSRYFVSDSLCCPSRASMLTGKFPHSTGVFTNTGADGGLATFNARGNEQATFAVALQAQGYRTALLGKYLNGYDPVTSGVPAGWSYWAVAGAGYAGFNYDLNQTGSVVHYGNADTDYMTDVLAGLGIDFIKASTQAPFVIELASFAPHAPYVPAPRDADGFAGVGAPRTEAFAARPSETAPAWLKAIEPLTDAEIKVLDGIHRKRLQSVQAIDTMIKNVRSTLEAEGIADNTYVVFTSDNGYHLGEYSLRAGKLTAFDTDIHVPLVVVGPGVPHGEVVDEIAQNIDLCPTFRELAGAPDSTQINGRSLVPFLRGEQPGDWRNAALVEHHGPKVDETDPDLQAKNSANPPSYAALRLRDALYVEYETGEFEYHDLTTDPYELENSAATLSEARKTSLHSALSAATSCKTASACWKALHVK